MATGEKGIFSDLLSGIDWATGTWSLRGSFFLVSGGAARPSSAPEARDPAPKPGTWQDLGQFPRGGFLGRQGNQREAKYGCGSKNNTKMEPWQIEPRTKTCGFARDPKYCGWTKSILHHFETMGTHRWLVVTGESSFHGFSGGAGHPQHREPTKDGGK